jgi:nitrate reductase (NAD(P)H)
MAASNPMWWRDERYAIYDLNVNSAAAYPQHNEVLDLATAGPSYTARGYAYAGGGRRVTRVEISLNKGKCMLFILYHLLIKLTCLAAWRLANIQYAEDRYRDFDGELFGGRVDMPWRETSYCWCFWSLDIPVSDLEASDALLVRSMDEAMSVQPRDMYWSVLGMMNNPWFRVTITKQNGTLLFEHPTHPVMAGGWMERVKKAGGDLTNGNWGESQEGETLAEPEPVKEINMKKEGLNRTISLEEFKKSNEEGAHWFIVKGEVYDGKPFLEGHPGGAQSIISSIGLDVTEDFSEIRESSDSRLLFYLKERRADISYR